MTSQAEDGARLQDVLGAFHAGAATRAETHSTVLDLILERVQCERVSMWRFDAQGDELSLLCFASKRLGGPFESGAERLSPAEYGTYYTTLIERGVYASSDALADPLLAPMRDAYLRPNGIVSMLDAAFLLNQRAYGRVCCEATAERRAWPASDVSALRGIVNKLALLMWTAPDPVLPAMPSLMVQPAPSASLPGERRRTAI